MAEPGLKPGCRDSPRWSCNNKVFFEAKPESRQGRRPATFERELRFSRPESDYSSFVETWTAKQRTEAEKNLEEEATYPPHEKKTQRPELPAKKK